jgi:CBS domain-containing protein
MCTAMRRLSSLIVRDVMSTRVVELSAHECMDRAAKVLVENGISAAPVVNEFGRCVGMLSATDFVKREQACADEQRSTMDPQRHELVKRESEPWTIEPCPTGFVSSHMTGHVTSVTADTPLLEAGRIMDAHHVHRLPVLGDDGRAVGIVSSMDIVAALLNAVDEMERLASPTVRCERRALRFLKLD